MPFREDRWFLWLRLRPYILRLRLYISILRLEPLHHIPRSGGPRRIIVKGEVTTFVVERLVRLKIRRNLFSAEKTRIDGPCPGSDHCQTKPENSQNNRHQGAVGQRESNPTLHCGYDDPSHWRPEAGDNQGSGSGAE